MALYSACLVRLGSCDERLAANRAACLLRLRCYRAALVDAKRAIKIAPSWARGYGRAATALTGLRRHAHAYWYHARGAYVDNTSSDARKGCAEVLGTLARDERSPDAAARDATRFTRDAGLSSTRVFSVSDVHCDHGANMDWVNGLSSFDYQRDVLIIAGNIGESLRAARVGLERLRGKFRRVFFVPGNRDLWIHPKTETSNEPDDQPDSIAKFNTLLELCDELDAGTSVACGGLRKRPRGGFGSKPLDPTYTPPSTSLCGRLRAYGASSGALSPYDSRAPAGRHGARGGLLRSICPPSVLLVRFQV